WAAPHGPVPGGATGWRRRPRAQSSLIIGIPSRGSSGVDGVPLGHSLLTSGRSRRTRTVLSHVLPGRDRWTTKPIGLMSGNWWWGPSSLPRERALPVHSCPTLTYPPPRRLADHDVASPGWRPA